jgi:hypothetical protein
VPSWIDKQAGRAKRVAELEAKRKALHGTWLERSRATAEFERELVATRQEERAETKRRALQPGTRLLPEISDEELAKALAPADPGPTMLMYPHLLILRERGFTTMGYADGIGPLDVPTYRGDRITEEGRKWLTKQTRCAKATSPR